MSYNSLGNIKSVQGDVFRHIDSIGSFEKNICISSENRLFSKGFWSKLTKFSSWHFSLVYVPGDLDVL